MNKDTKLICILCIMVCIVNFGLLGGFGAIISLLTFDADKISHIVDGIGLMLCIFLLLGWQFGAFDTEEE